MLLFCITITGMKISGIFLLFLLLVALLLPTIKCKYSAEEVNLVYYDLSMSSFPINADSLLEAVSPENVAAGKQQDPSSNAVNLTISNKYGQKYSCRVPTYVEPTSLDSLPTTKVTNEEILAVMDPILNGRCLLSSRETGAWWTYEFCYKSSIAQYHLANDNSIDGDITYLGHFESDKNWMSLEAMAELNGKRKQTLHHSQTYTNGTLCDLTNRFRRAEVRFVCDENAALANDAYLHSVDEPESCEYLLTVRTGALCRLPAFLPVDKKPPPVKIECQPVLEAAEYHAYIERKQAEETKKREEAERKKQQEQLRRQLQTEMRYLQTGVKERQQLVDSLLKLDILGTSEGDGGKKTAPPAMLEIFGKIKSDYLKMVDEKEAAAKSGAEKKESSKFATNLGAADTIEYEYMTHWLEQEIQNLDADEATAEATEQVAAVKGLSDSAKATVNEFKRDTRRLALSTTFKANLEALTDDMFDSVIWWDKKFERLGKHEKARATQEIKIALTKGLTTLIDELDDTERAMEAASKKTDLSGLVAFQQMREVAEARKLVKQQELDRESGKVPPAKDSPIQADVEGKQAATNAPIPGTDNKQFEDLWKELVSDDKRVERPSVGGGDQKAASSGVSNAKDHATTTADVSAAARSKAGSLRKDMESQLGGLMGDVERELKAEGAFDDLGDEAIAEVKTEALRSLAKTLTSLLEKLDDDEEGDGVEESSSSDAVVQKREKAKPESQSTNDRQESSSKKSPAAKSKKSNAWRKLIEELAVPDDNSDAAVKLEEENVDKNNQEGGGVKVRVSTIKAGVDAAANEVQSSKQSSPSKLERRIADKLQEAGFDTGGRQVQVKIFTSVNDAQDAAAAGSNNVHVLSDEEAEQFTNIVFNMFGGGGVERTAEQRRYQSLENSYSIGAAGQENEGSSSTKKSSSTRTMNTIVAGGGR